MCASAGEEGSSFERSKSMRYGCFESQAIMNEYVERVYRACLPEIPRIIRMRSSNNDHMHATNNASSIMIDNQPLHIRICQPSCHRPITPRSSDPSLP